MDDRLFNEIIAKSEVSKLRAVYAAIRKWESIANDEHESSLPDFSQMSERQADWAADHFNDETFMLHMTSRAMFASFAVSVFASVENFVGALCEDLVITFRNPRPNWRHKGDALEAHLRIEFRTLSGFIEINRARILGNCFKHNEGKTNDEYVAAFGGTLSQEIEYESENWSQSLSATEQFLLTLVGHT